MNKRFVTRVVAAVATTGAFAVGGVAAAGAAFADSPQDLQNQGYTCTEKNWSGIVSCTKADKKPQLCNTDNNACVEMMQGSSGNPGHPARPPKRIGPRPPVASSLAVQGPSDGPTDVLSGKCHFEGQAGTDNGQRAWCHHGKWVPVGSMSARPPRG